ncbi:MAG: amidase domain-containing protein [Eubacterium sp.]
MHRTDKSGNYDRDEAIEYAKKWYDDANTNDYQFFGGRGGDCTNFTSQCLFAGGIKKPRAGIAISHHGLTRSQHFFLYLLIKHRIAGLIQNRGNLLTISLNSFQAKITEL